MPKLNIELDVPDELLPGQLKVDFVAALRKHAVLDLVRHGKISQSRAAELLGVSRAERFELMTSAGVSQVVLGPGEVERDAERVANDFRQSSV